MPLKYLPDEQYNVDPSNRICVNRQWSPYVIGLLMPGLDPDFWRLFVPGYNPDDWDLMTDGIARMIDDLAQEPGDCITIPLDPCEGATNTELTNDFRIGNLHSFIITYGTRQNGVGLVPEDTVVNGMNVQRVQAHVSLAANVYCLKYLLLEVDYHGELYRNQNWPHGGEMYAYGKIGVAPTNWQGCMTTFSNDNFNGEVLYNTFTGFWELSNLLGGGDCSQKISEIEIGGIFANFGSNPHEVQRFGAIKSITMGLRQ